MNRALFVILLLVGGVAAAQVPVYKDGVTNGMDYLSEADISAATKAGVRVADVKFIEVNPDGSRVLVTNNDRIMSQTATPSAPTQRTVDGTIVEIKDTALSTGQKNATIANNGKTLTSSGTGSTELSGVGFDTQVGVAAFQFQKPGEYNPKAETKLDMATMHTLANEDIDVAMEKYHPVSVLSAHAAWWGLGFFFLIGIVSTYFAIVTFQQTGQWGPLQTKLTGCIVLSVLGSVVGFLIA